MQKFTNVIADEKNVYFIVNRASFDELSVKPEGPHKQVLYISDEVFNAVKNLTDLMRAELRDASEDARMLYREKIIELLETVKKYDRYEVSNSLTALGY